MREGKIIKSISGEYTIETRDSKIVCKPRGIFRYKGMTPKVGDEVLVNEETKSILEIKPRKNDLIRPVIANVDKAFLVFSVKEPELNLNLLDRMLAIIEFNNIEPIIIFTKLDLLSEVEYYNNIKEYYKKIGYKIYESSKEYLPTEVLPEIEGKLCVLAGQSGVGKSTLLNNFDSRLTLKTNEISKALGRGKHTTRHVELMAISRGYLADTPGFGTVDFIGMEAIDLSQSFREFFDSVKKCKFSQCLHINEPNCEVKRKVESGDILKSRYENYLLFVKEISTYKKKY